MLKFHKVWKTKTWATRMILEILGASLVDTYLACRHLMPMWRDMDTSESNFMAFVMDLTPQIDARTEEQLDLDADESSSEVQPDLMSPVCRVHYLRTHKCRQKLRAFEWPKIHQPTAM